MPELANWPNNSPNDWRCKEGRDDWADESLGLIGSADIREPLEQEIAEPDFQESRHENSEKLSWAFKLVRKETKLKRDRKAYPRKSCEEGSSCSGPA